MYLLKNFPFSFIYVTIKVLTGSHGESMPACIKPWISGGQAGMSKQALRPGCEY